MDNPICVIDLAPWTSPTVETTQAARLFLDFALSTPQVSIQLGWMERWWGWWGGNQAYFEGAPESCVSPPQLSMLPNHGMRPFDPSINISGPGSFITRAYGASPNIGISDVPVSRTGANV